MATPLPESWLLRVLRWAALLQYGIAALAFFLNLAVSLTSVLTKQDLAFVTLQTLAPQRGQLGGRDSPRPGIDQPVTEPPTVHYLVDKSQQQRLIYHEPSSTKRLALALLGVNNSSLGRASLMLLLFAMLSGRLFYHMLQDMRHDTPFTAVNARRIRWLALLVLSLDAYEWVARKALQLLVPAFHYGAGTVTPHIILDPNLGDWGSWKFGLVLLVVAIVYKRGVEMAHEAELTI